MFSRFMTAAPNPMIKPFSRAALTLALALLTPMAMGQPASAGARPNGHPPEHRMRDIIAKLSPAGRAIFQNDWANFERARHASRHDAARAAELDVFATMDAPNFDSGALRRAYAHQREVYGRNQKERQDHLVDVLWRLSPADRHSVVNDLRAASEH